jgi:hypothetical protein
VIGWKQWLGVLAIIALLLVLAFYSGAFMHGDP